MDMNKRHQNGNTVALVLLILAGVGVLVGLWLYNSRDKSAADTLPDADIEAMVPVQTPVSTTSVVKPTASSSPAESTPASLPSSPAKAEPVSATNISQPTDTPKPFKPVIQPKRRPYPMPGEKFDKPIIPTLLVSEQQALEIASAGSLQAKPGQIVPWDHARQYMGQTITVEGKVVLANKTRSVCFLNFTENWRGRFYVILFEGVLGSWPESADKYFLNKTIQVTGEVKERKGVPQIQVTDPKQVRVIQ